MATHLFCSQKASLYCPPSAPQIRKCQIEVKCDLKNSNFFWISTRRIYFHQKWIFFTLFQLTRAMACSFVATLPTSTVPSFGSVGPIHWPAGFHCNWRECVKVEAVPCHMPLAQNPCGSYRRCTHAYAPYPSIPLPPPSHCQLQSIPLRHQLSRSSVPQWYKLIGIICETIVMGSTTIAPIRECPRATFIDMVVAKKRLPHNNWR